MEIWWWFLTKQKLLRETDFNLIYQLVVSTSQRRHCYWDQSSIETHWEITKQSRGDHPPIAWGLDCNMVGNSLSSFRVYPTGLPHHPQLTLPCGLYSYTPVSDTPRRLLDIHQDPQNSRLSAWQRRSFVIRRGLGFAALRSITCSKHVTLW